MIRLDALDDAELAARAAAGDEPAFGRLIRRHKEPLYRFVRRLTGDADDAYDVLQQSFVAMWRSLHRYDPGRPFEAWARAITLNKCRDHARRLRVRRFLVALRHGGEPPDAPDDAPSAEAAAVAADALARVERAIAALPSALKEPLVLTALEGMSQADAAALLGITEKAVETRVRRARIALRAGTGLD